MSQDTRFKPPLDLPAPEGREAEWALLRLAQLCGIEEAIYRNWQELADAIAAHNKASNQCPKTH